MLPQDLEFLNYVYIKLMECYNFIVTLHKINIIFILNTILILIKNNLRGGRRLKNLRQFL